MILRLPIAALVLVAASASAADKQQIMFSRYLRAQICIDRAIGQRWHERYGIPMVMNRWGVSEPTAEGLAKWPEALRRAYARCRTDNEIASEPLPR